MPSIGFIVEGDGRNSIEDGRLPIERSDGPGVLDHLGRTVLFCWRQGGGTLLFFGRARLEAVEARAEGSGLAVRLSGFRLLKTHVSLPIEAWQGSAPIQALSDGEVAEILAGAGEPVGDWGLSEAQQFLAPDQIGAPTGFGRTSVKRLVLDAFGLRCAITGDWPGYAETAPDTLEIVPIRPEAEGGAYEPANLLPMTARARRAWESGLISVDLDGRLAISPLLADSELAGRLNPSGRIRLPADPAAGPDPRALLYHFLFVFQQRFQPRN